MSGKKLLNDFFQFIFPFIVVGILWEIIVDVGLITFIPSPHELLVRFYQLSIQKNILEKHLYYSFYRLIIGYLLATIFGIGVGVLIGVKKIVSDIFSPVLGLLISIPTIAWVPVLLITFGLGDKTVIIAIFLGGFFEVAYSTIHGIRMVDKNLVNAARIMGADRLKIFSHVLLPGAMTSIIPGLRLAIGYSWRALVGAEMLAAMVRWGIGKMIYEARFWNDIVTMFLGLVVIGIMGMLLDKFIMGYIEKETIERWGMIEKR
ncbi:MAG: ABC transporter permease [Thermoplasmata archaeon]|nr:ABC transporter permease [Thermoplasmata archaeon]